MLYDFKTEKLYSVFVQVCDCICTCLYVQKCRCVCVCESLYLLDYDDLFLLDIRIC